MYNLFKVTLSVASFVPACQSWATEPLFMLGVVSEGAGVCRLFRRVLIFIFFVISIYLSIHYIYAYINTYMLLLLL